MKVLIADDEIKVCRLIQHLVDWDALEMDIVGFANDGKTAYESICEKKPDIVITDIRMPVYDGLELIRRAKEVNPEINFIVISGYSQFEYAQQAIKYGVKDYLLKPLKKRELENSLTEIKESHESLIKSTSSTPHRFQNFYSCSLLTEKFIYYKWQEIFTFQRVYFQILIQEFRKSVFQLFQNAC